ncbi:OsmC family protein [Taibaiella chishuiensis]|uniref:Organic hydroperoxide reductase OsmC/OhrA n=1 Tax=Taibaiella chishuiensis TaxID=1434707 RepID=A0A2P8D5V9_9BACT|nr:OsmC family protein [Taibaiella chishuiensis]PSK92610.1 organic hydroperoxide reductase OsmC/OhrA [Taibaiella chishuiensis]
MSDLHTYATTTTWTGNTGTGTSGYTAYERSHTITAAGKPPLAASSDPAFRGDPAKYNPEELLLASVSGCHMLWYLHLCAVHQVTVIAYTDETSGEMRTGADGGGRFTGIVLRPRIVLGDPDKAALALSLHHKAHELCFIANSLNFPVIVEPQILTTDERI